MQKRLSFTVLIAVAVSCNFGTASAQTDGSITPRFSVVEASRLTLGWSVKRSILGKPVYNETGAKIGEVEDIIIVPDKNVSYVIIGAGGFIGINRHDVAIPVAALDDKGGKLILPGATASIIKSMPRFDYASDTARRAQYLANAKEDMAKAETKIGDLRKKAASATADAKAKLDRQADGLDRDLKLAEDKLAKMNRAAAHQWRDFEGDVSAAMSRLRKSLESSSS